MTPQFLAGIFSLMGAVFFFGAGYFFAKHRLSIDQDQLGYEIEAAKEREESIREKAIQDNISLKRKLDIQRQKSQAYKKASQKRISELTEQVGRMDTVIGDYKGRLNDLVVEITRADSEKILLNEALETTKKDLKDIENLEQKNQDLIEKLEFLKSQHQDIERLQVDNQELKEQILELEALKGQLKALKVEKARASAAAPASADSTKVRPFSKHKEFEKSLKGMVNQIAQLEGAKGVVVADKLGGLIAGTGEHMDKMAAMASIYAEMDQRISTLIPFDEIDVIKIQNTDQLTLSMHPFSIDSENLILSTFTNGNSPDRGAITELTEKVTSK